MLKTRIITSVWGIPIIIGCLWLGGWAWYGLFAIMAVLALYEYLRMIENTGIKAMWVPSYLLLLLLLAAIGGKFIYAPALIMIGFLILVAVQVLAYPRYRINDLALNAFGVLYIGFTLAWALRLEAQPLAFGLMMLVLLLTWSSDIGGYFVGRSLGRHKLAPDLSPNKTVEGALGGLLFSALVAMVFCGLYKAAGISIAAAAVFGLLGSAAAQIGDLFMSGVKRFCGVKDSGKVLPGHGGVLDRFDSFLLVMPLIYFLLLWQGVIPL
ncbi:MAG: phosphatidate cytidylyltransferase [Syntrophomonadaceae bacterium]|nr:phosphatidate cytidylyltransferase [Syntrophomonadaceae bacterium]